MELDTLFSGTRWDILTLLSSQDLSPNELAERLDVTPANISQQLRLLELGGLVKSEKTRNVEKGKPRVIYSLSQDHSYIILASKNNASKRLLGMSFYQKYMIRTFFVEDESYHEIIGKFYWQIEHKLDLIDAIAIDQSRKEPIIVLITDEAKKLGLGEDFEKKVRIACLSDKEFSESPIRNHDLLVMHDPSGLINNRGRGEKK